jgi:ribonuclease HI
MAKPPKYYVVWAGREPGLYYNWNDCKASIDNYENAKYKSFESLEEAETAFKKGWLHYYKSKSGRPIDNRTPKPTGDFIAVDAACSGNPGKMEYRGVFRESSQQIFHRGPFEEGTNNIGEFLALVHALALQKKNNTSLPVYSDSMNAIAWVKKKKCGTKLNQTEVNKPIFELIERAEKWLASNEYKIPVFKWETSLWGEIPADFGRK